MKSIKKYNGLHGANVSRDQLVELIELADQEEQHHIADKLKKVLLANADQHFDVSIVNQGIEAAPLSCLCQFDFQNDKDQSNGLAKAVSPTEIYDMITEKVIEALNKPLDFTKEWGSSADSNGGYLIAYNFDSGKTYRGINAFMLNSFRIYDPSAPLLQNPYFMTFNQVTAKKGKVRKGSFGYRVTYFTNLHTLEKNGEQLFSTYDREKMVDFCNKKSIPFTAVTIIPILKYYNVFNGADIEGIDFDLENFKGKGFVAPTKLVKNNYDLLPIPEAIVKAYPSPAPQIKHGGDDAFYQPSQDIVQMPELEQFNYVQAYYTTLFHELIHSTGSPKRLERVMGKKFGDKDYSFEELIAELGASFLSAEAGMLHYTFRNSAAYIKGWRARLLLLITDDNKFFFRAASQAQKAVDFMLDRNENGVAAYEKLVTAVQSKTVKPKAKKPEVTTVASPKAIAAKDKKTALVVGFALIDNIFGEMVASKKTLEELEKVYHELRDEKFVHLEAIVYEINSVKGKNVIGKKVEVNWVAKKVTAKPKEKPLRPKPIVTTLETKAKKSSEGKQLALFGAKKKGLKSPYSDPVQPKATDIMQSNVTGSLADRRNRPKVAHEYYKNVDSEIKKFLGDIEKKQKESVVITLTGGQGSMKTRALFQFMNDFAQNYKCGHASIEEHPESALYQNKVDQYLNETALHNIQAPEITSQESLDKLIRNSDVIFIDSFQKLREMVRGFEVDKDLRKKYDGKLFIIIFQQTTDGKMRGGSTSQFDADIVLFTKKEADYRDNYLYPDKNRYNSLPTDQLKFNIFSGKMIQDIAEVQSGPLELSFTVQEN